MKNLKDKDTDFLRVSKWISSCDTYLQLKACLNAIDLFVKKYGQVDKAEMLIKEFHRAEFFLHKKL